jgi:hypothetical protein
VQSDQVLEMEITPSRRMAVLLIAAHAVAVAAVWVSAMPIGFHIGLKFVVLASLWVSLREAGWLNAPGFVVALRIHPATKLEAGDRIEIRRRDGKTCEGEIVEGSVALPGFATVAIRLAGAPRWKARLTVVLLTDSAGEEALRHLRVRLRWGRPAPV